MKRFGTRVREALRTQLRLQETYADRWTRSGGETASAARTLRWRDDELVGWELPRPGRAG